MSDDTKPEPAADQPDAEAHDDAHQEDKKAKDTTPIYRRPFFWVLILVAGVAVVGGTLYYLHSRQFEATDDAFVDAHIVRIAPEVAGTLIDVADLDNRHVNAGQLLAVIKPTGPEAQLAEANAGVDQALAQLQQAQAQVSSAIATRNQAAAEAQAPLAAAVKAAQDLARYQNLAKIDRSAVASTQLDQVRANANSTRAQADAARRQIASADAQIAVARKQAEAASAVIAAKRAQVAQANVTLGNLRLVAPVSGQVVNRQVNKGSYVAPGSQLLAIVPDTMWVTANFKETQLKDMRIGQPVAIKVDAYPDVEFKGRVDSIQRGAGQAFAILPPQNATGNYVKVVQRVPVRINFVVGNGNPDPRNYPIGPGMSVTPSVKVR